MIAKGGRVFVALSAAAAAITFPFTLPAAAGFAGFTGFLMFVFRDPRRHPGAGIVAPADGKVREVDPEKGLVSIYLALRNVHVTRAPIEGTIEKVERSVGRHAPAFSKKTPNNERVEISMRTAVGDVSIVHMTGAIARRIVPYVERGECMVKAERLGLIRFGSRVDVFFPPGSVKLVAVKGQRLHAGVTPIAEVCGGDAQ